MRRARGRGRRTTLATRIGVTTVAVAALAVLVAGALALGLVRSAAETEARRTLGRFAALTATQRQVGGTPTGEQALRRLKVSFVRVRSDGQTVGSIVLPADVVAAVRADRTVDTVRRIGRTRYLIEARPVGAQVTPVLLQPVSTLGEITNPLGRRVLLALVIGLAAAVVAGLLLARRLAAPLAATAAAAHRLAAGERSVRVEPTGPAEVAEVGESLNALALALEISEGRQREFLLSVSHELRTPLTGIQGYAEAAADGVVPGPEAGATILAESRRLERLVSDLLDLARLGADDFRLVMTDVDVAALMMQAAAVWGRRCEEAGAQLRTELTAVVLHTDAGRLRQIVDGLAENALRTLPPGAPLVLGSGPDGSGGAVLSVRDGGPGLADGDLAVAFDRGALYDRYRDTRRVGTGLGLALVGGLVARLGGRIEAGHAPEGGAAFTITFAAAPDPT